MDMNNSKEREAFEPPIFGALQIAKALGIYEKCLEISEGNKQRAEFLARQRLYFGVRDGRFPFVKKWKGTLVTRMSEVGSFYRCLDPCLHCSSGDE